MFRIGRSRQLYILEYMKAIDPQTERYTMRVSLPDTATKEQIDAAFEKMRFTCDKRVALNNETVAKIQKEEQEKYYGDTQKNQANVDKLKGAAKKSN